MTDLTYPETWTPIDEATRVREWRLSCLVRAGVDELTAGILARCSADLHLMERAAKSGLSGEGLLSIFT